MKRHWMAGLLGGLTLQAVASPQGPSSAQVFDESYEKCSPVETQSLPAISFVAPGYALLRSSPKARIRLPLKHAKVIVLEPPKTGVVTATGDIDRDAGPGFRYEANDGTPDGTEDRIVFLIELGGQRIRVTERLVLGFNTESIDCKGEPFYARRVDRPPTRRLAAPERRSGA